MSESLNERREPGNQAEGNPEEPRLLDGERWAVAYAVSWLFCILFAYFVIRPVRETMGTLVGTSQLQALFLASFVVMLALVPLYASLVARLPRRWLVRVVFHFFAVCLICFWLLMRVQDERLQTWTARVLFVWISIFGVFSTSVFWSVLADLFSSRQGKRLFGIVAAGGTAGAIAGSLLTSQLASFLSTGTLLVVPAIAIELGLWCAWRLERQASKIRIAQGLESTPALDPSSNQGVKGGLLAGVTHVLRSPYLISICVFLFFVQGFGTQLYFEQAEIVDRAIAEKSDRTTLFAYLDLGTQLLTLLIQVGLSGLILRRLGVSVALVILPVVYFFGFLALAFQPSLSVLIVTMIVARGVGYGITVPSREVLFTVVSREDKYKSKSFIDTVVLRGGDTASGQIVGSLRSTAGVSLTALNLCALPIVAIWAAVAWFLGAQQRRLALASSANARTSKRQISDGDSMTAPSEEEESGPTGSSTL